MTQNADYERDLLHLVELADALWVAVIARAQKEIDDGYMAEFGHPGPSVAGVFGGTASADRQYNYYRHRYADRHGSIPKPPTRADIRAHNDSSGTPDAS